MAEPVVLFRTEKGKEGVTYQGYSYRFAKDGKLDDRRYWLCIDNKMCKGRIATNADLTNPEIRQGHNHASNPEKVKVSSINILIITKTLIYCFHLYVELLKTIHLIVRSYQKLISYMTLYSIANITPKCVLFALNF